MYFLLSPAKNLNETRDTPAQNHSQPPLLDQAEILMNDLRPLAPQQLADLMHISDKLALLNAERNAAWQPPFTAENAKPAIFMFNGDVYEGIDAYSRNQNEIKYIENHVRILSGLYGVLRPLDFMQAYRLEMGTALPNSRGKNLYEFWGERVTQFLNDELAKNADKTIVNLASQEYFKVIQPAKLNARLITPVFKDGKNGTNFKVVSFYAKRARGLMVRYAAENAIENVDLLKNFDLEGYAFNAAASSENEWVFMRNHIE